jgi:hypothetical protein
MDPDPIPDPTPFFKVARLQKKNFLYIFIFKPISRHIIYCLLKTFMKRKGSGSGFGSGRPKNIRVLHIQINNNNA